MSMSTGRFEINRKLRSIMIKHWIDLGRISIRTVRDRVFLHGSLQRLPGSRGEVNVSVVETIFDEIRRVKGVRHIRVELDNWRQVGAGNSWVQILPNGTSAQHHHEQTKDGGSLTIEDT
jgi:hypothetical protein